MKRKILLQRLLTDRRAKVNPADFGLSSTSGSGRRAPGLAQCHIDYLLNPGSRTYEKFERGKIEKPSAEYMYAVAKLLFSAGAFSEDDWVTLWAFARPGERPPYPLDPRTDEVLLNSWQELLDIVPCIAYITDVAWNVLCYNEAFAEVFVHGIPENIMQYMLSDEGQNILDDWEHSWAPPILFNLRATAAAQPHATLQRLVDRVLKDPITCAIYEGDQRTRTHPDGDIRPFNHPEYGKGMVRLNAGSAAGAPGSRLIFMRFDPAS
ncbi:hypothetical protein ABZW18_31660 [Streptomyces sp. NPDC004647]|uniref:MmyB family transcriptional regulator n=1 Tax=Streptomyces sp. NPDC004647 TaxID=3154671 RepID=UPI0033A6E6FF